MRFGPTSSASDYRESTPNPSLEWTRSGIPLGPPGRACLSSAWRAKRYACARPSAQTLGVMESPLRPAEIVIGFLPLVLPLAFFVVLPLPDKPVYGFTDSGQKYRRVDPPTQIPLLATRSFWLVFALLMAGAAGWALAEAIGSAVQFGSISLPGRRRYPRPVVPWLSAWAYLSGLVLLLLAVALPWLTRRESTARAFAQLAAALFGSTGYFLVLISPLVTSWQGTLFVAVASGAFIAYGRWRLRQALAPATPKINDA